VQESIFLALFHCHFKIIPYLYSGVEKSAPAEEALCSNLRVKTYSRAGTSDDRQSPIVEIKSEPLFISGSLWFDEVKVNQLFRNDHKARPHESMFFVNFATRLAYFY